MRSNAIDIHEIWKGFSKDIVTIEPSTNPLNFKELHGETFCPGPWYSFIFDMLTGGIIMHPNAKNFYGIETRDIVIQDYIERIHPDDHIFFLACEQLITAFLTEKIDPETMFKYKMVYSLRFLDKCGKYKLLLIQCMAFSRGSNGNMTSSMGIHSYIDHLTQENNYKLSIIGLDGYPSFLGIDVLLPNPTLQPTGYVFSPREIEIIRMISAGLTSEKIAKKLFISTDTVRTHRQNILKKSSCTSTSELLTFCFQLGIL